MSIIEDGTGSGNKTKVDNDNRLHVRSVSQSLQHVTSREDKEAFQVEADLAIATSEKNLLLIQNTDNDRDIVITLIRMGSAGAAATNTSAYFSVKVGGQYSSGGTNKTPINLFVGNSTPAIGTFKDGGSTIVTTGTFSEIDRYYDANRLETFDKQGALIIPSGQALLVSHVGSTVAGNAYVDVTFYYESVTDVS